MDANQPLPPRPLWVKIGLWGLPTRGSALVFCGLSMVLALASVLWGFWDLRFFAITFLLAVTAFYYWLAICWVDNHGGWAAPDKSIKSKLWVWTATAAVILGIAMFAVAGLAFFGFYRVPQDGMYPALPTGSRLLAVRHPYRDVTEVARGDIVVFARNDWGKQQLHVCRVIGLPGDLVSVFGDAVMINDKPVRHDKVRTDKDKIIYKETLGEAVYEVAYAVKPPAKSPMAVKRTVPPGQVFVVGDNRHFAVDSRQFGPVPFEAIIAKKW